jgi:hypothetical protein
MQTFLPYKSYSKSAAVLDYRRLGKQRVEAWQILTALTIGSRWKCHPATKMWSGYEYQLCEYGIAICKEWIGRGYRDTMCNRFETEAQYFRKCDKPSWLTQEFCISHQSNLVRKDASYYLQYFPNVCPNLQYVWPKTF